MTIEPISDERLAEIRADAEAARGSSFKAWPRFSPTIILALLARLDKAEADARTARALLTSLVNGDGPAVTPNSPE